MLASLNTSPQNYLDLASSTLMQQTTFKHRAYCNIHLQWSYHHSALYFLSTGICYTIKEEMSLNTYKKESKKEKKKKKRRKSGNRKVFNLNPVPKKQTKPVLVMWP